MKAQVKVYKVHRNQCVENGEKYVIPLIETCSRIQLA